MSLSRAAALERLFAQPIAHRGLHGCGRGGPVENSLGAARAAIAAGYGIECDVRLSRDGVPIVFHDEPLERLTGRSGSVESLTADALAQVALGDTQDTIPRLADLLDLVAGRTPIVVEIKRCPGADLLTERTMACLARYDGPVALESFDATVVRRCLSEDARWPVGLVGPDEGGAETDDALLDACDFASWHIESIEALAALAPKLPRSTWTVRDAAQRARAEGVGAQIVFEGFDPATKR